MRRLALACALGLWAATASAGAPEPSGSGPSTASTSDIERWVGRYCVAPGCGEAGPSPFATLIAFGGVVGGAAWWSRRTSPSRLP